MIIYQILNKINNKCYIGQTATSFARRYDNGGWHIQSNNYLRNAARKYGLENFEINILEDGICSINELNEKEIFYIKKFNSIMPNGYNLMEGGQRTLDRCHHEKSKEKMSRSQRKNSENNYRFLNHHTNKIVEVANLSKFCRENNLSHSMICNVANGKYKRHKNWTLPKTKLKKWILRDPIGNTHLILEGEFRAFEKNHNIKRSGIYALIHKGYKSHNGWTVVGFNEHLFIN
jgi:group I intron endonuclease